MARILPIVLPWQSSWHYWSSLYAPCKVETLAIEQGVSMLKRDIVLQVKELVERHLDVIDIAHRLHMDVPTVMSIIEVLKQSLS